MTHPGPPPVLRVRQLRQASFRALIGSKPTILLVVEGEKHVEGPGFAFTLPQGGMAVLPDRLPLTIENRPGRKGYYEARALFLERSHFEAAEALAATATQPLTLAAPHPAAGLKAAFDRLAAALSGADPMPERVRQVLVLELIVWLAEAGIRLPPAVALSLGETVRSVVERAIDRDWKAEDVAAILGMSEPTLRRKLRAEGASFQDLLTDTRMTTSLSLLQSTEWPVSSVALAVGYGSPSRFAVRFRNRFGLSPAEIRLIPAKNDRIGTINDRAGREAQSATP